MIKIPWPFAFMNDIDWTVIETTDGAFNSTQLHHKETVFTLSNGYLGTRGTFEEGYPGSCPATLINGVYDAAPVVITELANCPDWLSLTIRLEDTLFRLDQGEILDYKRWLNLYRGTLSRKVLWCSPSGHTLEFIFERFISFAHDHIGAIRCQIHSIDFVGKVEIQAGLNGYPDNEGLLHWKPIAQGGRHNQSWLHLQSRQSKIDLAIAARLDFSNSQDVQTNVIDFQGQTAIVSQFTLQANQTIQVDKIVTFFTSNDTEDAAQAAIQTLADLPAYHHLLKDHTDAWAKVWEVSDIVIEGDSTAQLAIRYNIFQLLSATPRHSDRVSIPAKALSGFAYRGHVFWDTEVFMLPFLIYTQPQFARNLLTYRYHTLPGARRKAQAAGYEGAMYAWESANTGDEVTPSWVPSACNPKELVRIWCGDIELHITTDVAYGVWQYWQATGDDEWMQQYGAEMILDTAVFWGSRVEWNEHRDRYDIRDVIGPDEYHDRIDNNAFTNRMVQWHLQVAIKTWYWLEMHYPEKAVELKRSLNLSLDRLAKWAEITYKLWVSQDPETGLIEQFEGFFNLEDINLEDYEPRVQSMQTILGIEGANKRQVLKQADVLMLLYLLRRGAFGDRFATPSLFEKPETVLADALRDRQILQANWDYYNPRTDHTYGSSLSPAIHAILACELGDPNQAYEHFMRSVLVDLADIRGNAAEGVHAASTGGVWQAMIFGFAGIHMTANGPTAAPALPKGWTRLKFNLMWNGKSHEFDLKASTSTKVSPSVQSPDIAAVIFDLDGVITDTAEFHYQGWQRLADEEGLAFSREINEALRGVSRRDSLRYLLGDLTVSEELFQEMMDRKNRYYLEFIRTIAPENLLPGVKELFDDLKSNGIKIALGSSSKNAPEVLERLGVAHYMDAIADGNSVTQSKPAPDVFLHAAKQLAIHPNHCLVMEDAASGIEAALRAGMWTVGLGDIDRVKDAHLTLPHLAETLWADLLNRLAQATHRPAIELTVQTLIQQQALKKAKKPTKV